MCHQETKKCARCKIIFDCKSGNISHCPCYGIVLSDDQKAYLEQRYTDCLCRSCLQNLPDEFNLFKEKYIFR